MPVTRKVVFRTIDSGDYDTIPNFIHTLRTNSMYRYVVEDLMARPGFIKKEYIMREDKTGQSFISQIFFEDWDTFNTYMNTEETESIWEFLKISAGQSGITYDLTDEEVEG